jgi:hypothetical protein
MKNMITSTALMLCMANAQAGHEKSELHLKMYDGSAFTVVLANLQYNQPGKDFCFPELQPGNYYMKCTRQSWVHHGHCVYPVYQTVFSGWISIPENQKIFAMIDCYNSFKIVSACPLWVPPAPVYNYGTCTPGYSATPACAIPASYPVCMGMNEFIYLKNTIATKPFDSSRLLLAKQAIEMNYVSSAQVAQLMTLFTFESNRLDLAKFAFHHTVDKQNYYLVNDAFTFQSSIHDLNRYISGI